MDLNHRRPPYKGGALPLSYERNIFLLQPADWFQFTMDWKIFQLKKLRYLELFKMQIAP